MDKEGMPKRVGEGIRRICSREYFMDMSKGVFAREYVQGSMSRA